MIEMVFKVDEIKLPRYKTPILPTKSG